MLWPQYLEYTNQYEIELINHTLSPKLLTPNQIATRLYLLKEKQYKSTNNKIMQANSWK